MDENPLRGCANLAGVAEASPERRARGEIQIRIGHDDHRIFAAELEIHGIRCSAAAAMIFFPVATLPVKKIFAGFCWITRRRARRRQSRFEPARQERRRDRRGLES